MLLDRQMGATTQPREGASRPGESASRLQLRLRADGQVLNLLSGKTTIGSSPRCNIRIEQPGVQPLHCLIVDGPAGLRVRSWAGNTKLNGAAFEESALDLGDCLSLGPVELEIIDPQAGRSLPEAVEAPIGDTRKTEQIRAGRDQARTRSRQLLATLRRERTANHALSAQMATLQESHLDGIAEQNSMSRELNCLRAELAAARPQLVEYQLLDAARQELAERNEQLGFEVGELSAQVNQLTHKEAETATVWQALAEEHSALQQEYRQLAQTNSQLEDEVGRLASEKAAADERHRHLTEANQRLAHDNATLLAGLEDARQQVEKAKQDRAGFADSTAELGRERAAKLQAESDAAAAIAEGERRLAEQRHQFAEQSLLFAEQERQFAESIRSLELQLAAVGELRDSLARAREETQLQLANAESHSAQQSRRILELEAQLAAAEGVVATLTEQASSQTVPDWNKVSSEPPKRTTGQGSSSSDSPESFGESTSRVTDDQSAQSVPGIRQAFVDVAAFGDEAVSSPPHHEPKSATWPVQLEADLPNESRFERQEQEVGYIFPVAVDSEASLISPKATDGSTASKSQSMSYIDRFSHMFTVEGVASQDELDRSYDLAHPVQLAAGPERSEADETSANKSEEEESIEQYMAKLLQRVRGEAPTKLAAPVQPMGMPLDAPVPAGQDGPCEHSAPLATALPMFAVTNEVLSVQNQPEEIREPAKRKISVPASKTDLGALRAIANETARRAIGQHELRTLRRKAVTKVIVATLAGMTSLWLMLESPDWRDVQFITGCVSLLVAAYWAGETFRTLVASLRAAAYRGPENGRVEAEASRAPGLPIDVESEERR